MATSVALVKAGAATALWLATTVLGYGTTVLITTTLSSCPAIYTSSSTRSTTGSSASTTPSITPGEPFVLTFSLNGVSEYLKADGTTTIIPVQAIDYSVTSSGLLISADGYVSTSGDVAIQPFAISSDMPGAKRASRIFNQFRVSINRILEWINDAFAGGQAIFCVSGSMVMVVFDGMAPPGCIVIQLGAVLASELNQGPRTSTTAMPQPTSSNMLGGPTSISQPPSNSGSPSGAGSTSNPIVFTSMTPPSPVSSFPIPTPSSQDSSPSAVASSMANSVPPQSSSVPSPSTSGTDYPAPTTTGTPNCFDRSPFDGTVNDGYLLLCDTSLPGYELDAVPASDIAECIDTCKAYVQTSEVTCVAVEFDILASGSPCHLKYDVDTVNRGTNSFAQAAIIVNVPYAPDIVFSDNGGMSSASSAVKSTTTVGPPPPVSTIPTTPNGVNSPTTSPSFPPMNPTTFTSGMPGSPSAGPFTSSSMPGGMQSNSPAGSPTMTGMSSRAISSSPFAISTGQQPSTMTTSRNPGSSSPGSNPASSSPAASPASSSLVASIVSSAPVVSPASSSPTASPVSSIPITTAVSSSPAVNPASSSPTASPSASSTTTVGGNPGSTSRPATSNPASANQATSSSSTPIVSVLTTTSSRTIAPLTTAAAAAYCSTTPTNPNANFCPTYNHQGLNVNSDGYCYEIECSTSLQGTVLSGGSYVEVSNLRTCISLCTNYNVALPFGCVGVNYLYNTGASANCLLLSTITGTIANSSADSGRLLYAGYPSITDPLYPLPSSTTTRPSTSSTAVPVVPASSVSNVATSRTSYIPTTCPSAPSNATQNCPGGSPFCYQYNGYGNSDSYEIECSTQFTGSSTQPLITFDLNDCIDQCQYANVLRTNACLGVTFVTTVRGQGSSNNCYPYSSITCGTRGNATFNSARMLYAGYPQMTDYNPSFLC